MVNNIKECCSQILFNTFILLIYDSKIVMSLECWHIILAKHFSDGIKNKKKKTQHFRSFVFERQQSIWMQCAKLYTKFVCPL